MSNILPLDRLIDTFITAANAFDVDAALALFTPNALIDDPSTGKTFLELAGVQNYLEQYFVGYHTVTKLLSLEIRSERHAVARVDFTGDFGHEIGLLEVFTQEDGRIIRIQADLE